MSQIVTLTQTDKKVLEFREKLVYYWFRIGGNMKKGILLLALSLFIGASAFATEATYVITDLDMNNFWQKTGKAQEKVSSVAMRIMESNKLDKRAPIVVVSKSTVNAYSNTFYKNITVYTGLLNLIDNDDELAYILGHEMAHSVEAYGGPLKYVAMCWNSKNYEIKSDLKSIDYMVKAGYDPIAAIVMGSKFFAEPMWDWGFLSTHPKGSKRLLAMYKYIYKKYPQYLTSPKTNNPYYKNFEYFFDEELKAFRHKESVRRQKQLQREAL